MTQLRINIEIILINSNKLDSSMKRKAFPNCIIKQNQLKQEIYLTQRYAER